MPWGGQRGISAVPTTNHFMIGPKGQAPPRVACPLYFVASPVRELGSPQFHSKSQAFAFIRSRTAKGGLWCTPMKPDHGDNLHERFEVKRIHHQEASSLDGACTHQAEKYFSRLRRAEICIHSHIAGTYLLRYAQEN